MSAAERTVVLVLSARGALLRAMTQPHLVRADAFSYFAGWISVATSAAGVYGFTRAAANRITEVTPRRILRSARPEYISAVGTPPSDWPWLGTTERKPD